MKAIRKKQMSSLLWNLSEVLLLRLEAWVVCKFIWSWICIRLKK